MIREGFEDVPKMSIELHPRNFTDGSQYFILLIVTDGIITDMPQTKSVSNPLEIGDSLLFIKFSRSSFDEMLSGHQLNVVYSDEK